MGIRHPCCRQRAGAQRTLLTFLMTAFWMAELRGLVRGRVRAPQGRLLRGVPSAAAHLVKSRMPCRVVPMWLSLRIHSFPKLRDEMLGGVCGSLVQPRRCCLNPTSHNVRSDSERLEIGQENYVKQWPFSLLSEALDHYFTYFWGPGQVMEMETFDSCLA